MMAFEVAGAGSTHAAVGGRASHVRNEVVGGREAHLADCQWAASVDSDAMAPILEPYETRRAIFRTFNLPRVLMIAVLAVLVLICVLTLSQETFTVESRIDSSWNYTLETCREKCAQAETTLGDCGTADGARKYKIEYKEDQFIRWNPSEAAQSPLTGYCHLRNNVPKWKSMVCVAVFSFAIVLVVEGARGEVILVGGAAILAALGILDKEYLYSGLSSGGVMGLALLFPIADTISDTGVLEKGMGIVLGTPSSLTVALVRLCAPVVVVSAFLSNTAVVALMIPVVLSWARRINIHPGKLLMPLSFAAQLGGSITKVGSSHVVVAYDVTRHKYRDGGMGMFDMAACAIFVALASVVAIVLSATTSLLSSSAAASGGGGMEAGEADAECYRVKLRIGRGPFLGKPFDSCGLERCGGVMSVSMVSGNASSMKEGDVLEFLCDINGVLELRSLTGISLTSQKLLSALGAHRRKRFLFETSVDAESEFLSSDILAQPERLLAEFGAVLVAGPKARAANREPKLRAGSVLLFEANEDWITLHAAQRWNQACSLITKVRNSSPKRTGGPVDDLRSGAVCGTMVFMIFCLALVDGLELFVAASILVLFYLLIRAISPNRVFETIKPDILLIITGAIAFGEALTSTGVVAWVAGNVLAFAHGQVAVMATVYITATFLGAFVNNSAVVAILAPMLESICESDPSMSFEGLTWILTLASGTCFTTPLGYQTNLMVMPGGQHSFGDYLRYGAVNQFVHMIASVLFVMMFQPASLIGASGVDDAAAQAAQAAGNNTGVLVA